MTTTDRELLMTLLVKENPDATIGDYIKEVKRMKDEKEERADKRPHTSK